MTAIVLASIIFAVLITLMLRQIGFNWRSSIVFAVIMALGVGASAAHAVDLL